MTYGNSRSGANNVGEYQASGLPWVTSSVLTATPFKVEFPYVTNHISIYGGTGSTDGVRLGFSLNGVNGSNYALVKGGGSWVNFDIRCKEVYIRSDVGTVAMSMCVGLTMIENKSFPVLTASAIYGANVTGSLFGYGKPGDPGVGSGLG
jgi:hypothetical protein